MAKERPEMAEEPTGGYVTLVKTYGSVATMEAGLKKLGDDGFEVKGVVGHVGCDDIADTTIVVVLQRERSRLNLPAESTGI